MPEIRTVTTLKRKRARSPLQSSCTKSNSPKPAPTWRMSRPRCAYLLHREGHPTLPATLTLTGCSSAGSLGRSANRRSPSGPHDTRELAIELMRAKGMDTADTVLAKGLTNRLIHRCGCRKAGAGSGGRGSGRALRSGGCRLQMPKNLSRIKHLIRLDFLL